MGIIHGALLLNRARVTYKPQECALHDIHNQPATCASIVATLV